MTSTKTWLLPAFSVSMWDKNKYKNNNNGNHNFQVWLASSQAVVPPSLTYTLWLSLVGLVPVWWTEQSNCYTFFIKSLSEPTLLSLSLLLIIMLYCNTMNCDAVMRLAITRYLSNELFCAIIINNHIATCHHCWRYALFTTFHSIDDGGRPV